VVQHSNPKVVNSGEQMRVGVVGPMGLDRVAENIADALRRMGHQVTPLGSPSPRHRMRLATRVDGLVRRASPRLDEWAQRGIAKAALDAECEVIINVDSSLMPGVVTELRRHSARVAFWFPDHVAGLGRQLMLLGPYDAIFFKEPHIVDHLRALLDLPVYYLPEACNPRWHRPLVAAGTDPHIAVAATMYPSRVRLLERLVVKGIPLKLYGRGFPRWLGDSPVRAMHTGRVIFREEKAIAFRSAVGVLNTMYPAEIAGVNGRLFQAAGSGAAVLCEYRPTLPDLFVVGEEVLAFHDFDELVDQATLLLNQSGLTARLGDAASKRAHRDHTYELRLATILEKLS